MNKKIIEGVGVESSQDSVPIRLFDEKLLHLTPAIFAFRIVVWCSLMLLGALLAAWSSEWFLIGLGIFILGAAMVHGVELTHQALHYTGFRAPYLNEAFGLLMGMPMLVSFYEYRIDHLRHHATLGTAEDRGFFSHDDNLTGSMALLCRFMMLDHYVQFMRRVFDVLRGKKVGDYPERYQVRIKSFYSLILIVIGLGVILLGPKAFFIWGAALLFVASPLHVLIEFPEHFRCESKSKCVYENTRTIKSNVFMSWFTNNNNFHVEHHLWPQVPVHRVNRLHVYCADRCRYIELGYLDFFMRMLSAPNATTASTEQEERS